MAAPLGMTFDGFMPYGGHAVEPDVIFESIIENCDITAGEILKPFFEKVWDSFGLQGPDL